MVLLTPDKHGPLVGGGWYEGTMYGVVTERAHNWIKVAFESGPSRDELQDIHTWRWAVNKAVQKFTHSLWSSAMPFRKEPVLAEAMPVW